MEQINFIGVEPTHLINEIVNKIETSLLLKLTKQLQDNEPNRYYTAQQICEMFSITKPTLNEWRKRGMVNSKKLGGRRYFTLEDIENGMIDND